MKRYFVSSVQPDDRRFHCGSPYHYTSLPGSGYIIVMMSGEFEPDPTWTELPHVLDSATAAQFNGVNEQLGQPALAPQPPIGGVAMTDPTHSVARKVAAINSHFHP